MLLKFCIYFFLNCIQEGVGMKAINDAFYLESAIYALLKKHIRDQPYYVDIVDLFHEVNILFGYGNINFCVLL